MRVEIWSEDRNRHFRNKVEIGIDKWIKRDGTEKEIEKEAWSKKCKQVKETLLIPFGKFVFVTQRNCVATEQRH